MAALIGARPEQIALLEAEGLRAALELAEGAPTESFLVNLETQRTLTRAQRDEFAALFPQIGEIGHSGAPAHVIPSRVLQKELVRRHVKNERHLLSL